MELVAERTGQAPPLQSVDLQGGGGMSSVDLQGLLAVRHLRLVEERRPVR
jgi:hypothetical protein